MVLVEFSFIFGQHGNYSHYIFLCSVLSGQQQLILKGHVPESL